MAYISLLIINMSIAEIHVKNILVDMGSCAKILYWEAFKNIKLSGRTSKLLCTPIRLWKDLIDYKGIINLLVKASNKIKNTDFLVVDASSSYNAILGRHWVHYMETVPLTIQQMVRWVLVIDEAQLTSEETNGSSRMLFNSDLPQSL